MCTIKQPKHHLIAATKVPCPKSPVICAGDFILVKKSPQSPFHMQENKKHT